MITTKKIGKPVLITYLIQILVWLALPIIFTLLGSKSVGNLSFYDDLTSPHKNLQYISISVITISYLISCVFVSFLFGRQVRKINFISEDTFLIYFFILPPFNFIISAKITKIKYHVLYSTDRSKLKISFDNDNDISSIQLFYSDWQDNDWVFIKAMLEKNALSVEIEKKSKI